MSSTEGDRLADWLESLGLADQLAAAGLPTYTRDESGHATWSEPDRVAELDEALRSQGSDPEHAVPVALVLLRRRAQVRAALLDSPCFTYETLAQVRGASVDATRYAVHKAAHEHRLLLVPVEDHVVIPAFQLLMDGEVRPELLPLLDPLLEAGMEPWQVWSWLTQPAALTFGLAPSEAVTDPDSVDLVTRAAVALAARVTSD